MTKPAALRSELVATTGSTAKITADQAVQAVAHVRKVAARTLAVTEDGTALDWAHSYLGTATTLDVGMSDMRERFAAFEHLERNSPWDRARAETISIAAAGIVLRDIDGTRYVRCGWFASFVRQQDATAGQAALAVRMARIGWERRGSAGNVKATSSVSGRQLVWSFYVVGPDWRGAADDEPPGSPVAPGIGTTRARRTAESSRVEGATKGYGATETPEASASVVTWSRCASADPVNTA